METADPPIPADSLRLPAKVTERFYTAQSLLQLFLICAFPVHLWSLLMAFRDFGWVSLRTGLWDGIGLLSYALSIALVESIFFFIVTVVLGLLVPSSWSMRKRLALIGTLFLVVALWSILVQLFFLYGSPVPGFFLAFAAASAHPLWVLWGAPIPVVFFSVAVPVVAISRSVRLQETLMSFFDRLVVLSSFYIALDIIGLVIIAIRNIAPRVGM